MSKTLTLSLIIFLIIPIAFALNTDGGGEKQTTKEKAEQFFKHNIFKEIGKGITALELILMMFFAVLFILYLMPKKTKVFALMIGIFFIIFFVFGNFYKPMPKLIELQDRIINNETIIQLINFLEKIGANLGSPALFYGYIMALVIGFIGIYLLKNIATQQQKNI